MLARHVELHVEPRPAGYLPRDLVHLRPEVDRVVAQRMDARAHHRERVVDRCLDVGEVRRDARLARMHHAQRLRLQRGTRELVADVVVDLARDAGALGERGELDLVLLAAREVAVPLLEAKGAFLQVVAGILHTLPLALELSGP